MARTDRLVATATVFYGLLTVGAIAWATLAGRSWLSIFTTTSNPQLLGVGAAIGVAIGLGLVAISHLLVKWFTWAQTLVRWFADTLGPIDGTEAFLLACCSAIGEESFFRGAMQPTLGLWWTTAIFGLAHLPVERRLLPWTTFALIVGWVFGYLTLQTDNIAGAMTAHFLVNWINLHRLGKVATN